MQSLDYHYTVKLGQSQIVKSRMRPTLNQTILHSIFITTLDALAAGWLEENQIREEETFFRAVAVYQGSPTLFVPFRCLAPSFRS